MQLRRRILKGLLASLALAAVAGVLAVLLPGREVMVRVMLTGLATAGAAVFMIAFTFMLPRAESRPGGLFGMTASVVMFALCLLAIWLETWLSNRVQEKIGLTIAFVALTSLPMIVTLSLVRRPAARIGAWTGSVTTGLALAVYMLAIWLPGNVWMHDEWWGSAWTILGYGLLVATCLIGVALRGRDAWRLGGAIAGGLGAATLVAFVWQQPTANTDPLEKTICVLTSLAAVAGLANLLLLPERKPHQGWVAFGTIAAAALTAVFVNVLVVLHPDISDELFERLIAAGGIVTASGSLAVVVLAALNRRTAIETHATTLTEITVVCPACRAKQAVPIGSSACARCGLRMEIKVQEPRCAGCGYLLMHLASDRCPECGARVGNAAGSRERDTTSRDAGTTRTRDVRA